MENDLTKICSALPVSSVGDVSTQATAILQGLTGETEQFVIGGGEQPTLFSPTITTGWNTVSWARNSQNGGFTTSSSVTATVDGVPVTSPLTITEALSGKTLVVTEAAENFNSGVSTVVLEYLEPVLGSTVTVSFVPHSGDTIPSNYSQYLKTIIVEITNLIVGAMGSNLTNQMTRYIDGVESSKTGSLCVGKDCTAGDPWPVIPSSTWSLVQIPTSSRTVQSSTFSISSGLYPGRFWGLTTDDPDLSVGDKLAGRTGYTSIGGYEAQSFDCDLAVGIQGETDPYFILKGTFQKGQSYVSWTKRTNMVLVQGVTHVVVSGSIVCHY